MQTRDKAAGALLSAFPTQGAWRLFFQNSDNQMAADTLLSYAVRAGLIPSADTQSLETFIIRDTAERSDVPPPPQIDFEELLDKKDELLRINLSVRALTERINALLAEKQIALPKITNSMLTRLKKEPVDTNYKQNVLRSLAFWLGHERPDIARSWRYDSLLAICSKGRQTENYREGARIGFALYSRGDVIDHELLDWLRKTIKAYIDQSISRFSYGRWGKVRTHDITTFYVDFPKEEASGDLAAYTQCLRSAVSLAHQISIRWALSSYSTKNRFLSIAIVVGEFAGLDNHLLPLLNAKLPNDPVIRLSDMARQCVLINDIRVVLCSKPTETALFNGEALIIWWIEAFWSTLYFDFVSELLADPILQNSEVSIKKLNRMLWPDPDEPRTEPGKSEDSNAVAAFFKFPNNSLLGVEIAKTLYYRRRFTEALEIVRIVLSINPTDLIARTLRMILLRSIAVDLSALDAAGGLFRQALREAQFILTNCACESEDFYCEYAVVYLAQAMSVLRYARENGKTGTNAETPAATKKIVFEALETAEALFEHALVVSPSGIRSAYLLSSVRLLITILQSDENIFIDPARQLSALPEARRNLAINLHWQIGFRRPDLPEDLQNDLTKKLIVAKGRIHDDAVALQSYRPTIYFCHAVALWDFLPDRTGEAVQRARLAILKAMDITRNAKKDDVCIYAYTRTYGEMIPPDDFLGHLENCLTLIDKTADQKTAARKGKTVLPSPCLMTVNF